MGIIRKDKQYPLFCIEMSTFDGIIIGAESSEFFISQDRFVELNIMIDQMHICSGEVD